MADTSNSSRGNGGYVGAGASRIAPGIMDRAHDEVAALGARAQEAGSSAAETTKDAASSVVHKVEDMAVAIGHGAEGAMEAVGGEMKSLAGTIRDNAPKDGVLGSSAAGVAGTLESGGAYLQAHNLQDVAEDVTNLVRRYPFQALLAGIGVGFLVGRALRK